MHGLPPDASDTGHRARKADHIRIALEEEVGPGALTTGLERYRFVHQALPEIDLAQVDPSLDLFGHRLSAPLLISCMTGGVERGGALNRTLAVAAQRAGIALGVGSQRAALDEPALADTFRVRHLAPDVPLLANLGAAQLAGPQGLERARRAVAMIEADALVVHVNPLQEALQPEGTAGFAGLTERIAQAAAALDVPVIVKEVGWGIAENVAAALAEAGVAGVDVAGAGGTSWSEVERHRIADPAMAEAAATFRDWGIPTADCVLGCRRAMPDGLVIASGGLRSGLDVATCIALGADLGAMAAPFLRAAVAGPGALTALIGRLTAEIRIAMFCVGAATLGDLRRTPHLVRVDAPAAPARILPAHARQET
jgi:isopentenyl-diphosphate delta-isomerase